MKVIPHRLHLSLGLRPCLSEVKTKTSLVPGSHKFRFDLARRLLRECELDGFKPSSSKGQRDVAAEGSGGRGFRVYGRRRRTRFTLQASRFYSDLCPLLFSTETEAGVKRRETVWQANARPDRTSMGCCMSGTFRVSNATLSERESRWHRAPHILST